MAKKKRSAKQLANDKRLGRMAKKRAAAKRKKNPARKKRRKVAKKTARRRPRKKTTRKRNPTVRAYRVFMCNGSTVKWLTIASDLRYGWTSDTGVATMWRDKTKAEKLARKLQKRRGYAYKYLGVCSADTSAATVKAHCKQSGKV